MSNNSVKSLQNSSCEYSIAEEIDTCGTRCPLPLLRAKQALKSLQVGDCLKVLATDPAAKPDFEAMLSHLPHQLVEYQRHEGLSGKYSRIDVFIIRKGVSEGGEV